MEGWTLFLVTNPNSPYKHGLRQTRGLPFRRVGNSAQLEFGTLRNFGSSEWPLPLASIPIGSLALRRKLALMLESKHGVKPPYVDSPDVYDYLLDAPVDLQDGIIMPQPARVMRFGQELMTSVERRKPKHRLVYLRLAPAASALGWEVRYLVDESWAKPIIMEPHVVRRGEHVGRGFDALVELSPDSFFKIELVSRHPVLERRAADDPDHRYVRVVWNVRVAIDGGVTCIPVPESDETSPRGRPATEPRSSYGEFYRKLRIYDDRPSRIGRNGRLVRPPWQQR